MTGHAPTVIADTVYAGRHRGTVPAAKRITARLYLVDGLYRQESASTGIHYWSADGNDYYLTPADAIRAATA